MDRKDFFKKACFTGFCFCGCSTISSLAHNDASQNPDKNKQLSQDWLSNLLSNLNNDLDEDVLRDIVKKSSLIHYNNLNMDALLSDYIGDLDKFNKYIEREAWQ